MTNIEWTDKVWNPTVGCTVLSPGCTNCYAMKMAARLEAMGVAHYAGTTQRSKAGAVWTGKLAMAPAATLTKPLRWRKPARIFVNSMSDLFHESVPDAWIDQVFAVMALAPQHTFQVLTKRAARMRAYLTQPDLARRVIHEAFRIDCEAGAWMSADHEIADDPIFPLPNVWLGVSAEDQTRADERIPDLLATPAAVRFVSLEPLIGPVDLTRIKVGNSGVLSTVRGTWGSFPIIQLGGQTLLVTAEPPALDWVIAGGESGSGARPMHPDWARQIRDACAAAGVAFHFKQWGAWSPSTPETGRSIESGWVALNPPARSADDFYPAHGAAFVELVGKAAAGRTLDGAMHDAFPGVAP